MKVKVMQYRGEELEWQMYDVLYGGQGLELQGNNMKYRCQGAGSTQVGLNEIGRDVYSIAARVWKYGIKEKMNLVVKYNTGAKG